MNINRVCMYNELHNFLRKWCNLNFKSVPSTHILFDSLKKNNTSNNWNSNYEARFKLKIKSSTIN